MYIFTTYHVAGLGHAKNMVCEVVPRPEDWIVLLDSDVMMFPTHWPAIAQLVAENHPQFSLFTCMATRTWAKGQQQLPGRIREERDLGKLKAAAENCARTHGDSVKELPTHVSGFFLMFRKSLWLQQPFPLLGHKGDRNLGIETLWVRQIRALGHRVGCFQGLAAVHYYRLNEGDTSKAHLK